MIAEKTDSTTAYRELCVAVILQAVNDLKKALLIKANTTDPKQQRLANDSIRETTKFLRDTTSPYHQMLTVDLQIFPELVDRLLGAYAAE